MPLCASPGSSPAGLACQLTSGGVRLHGTDVGVDWVITAAEHTLGFFQSCRQSPLHFLHANSDSDILL